MDKTVSSILPRIADAAWRRRYLLLVPVFVMTLLSLLGVFLLPLPGSYVARSLMLLRETDTNNPFSKDTSQPGSDRLREHVAGLQALLDSEYVLGPVVDATGDELKVTPKRRAAKIEELRKRSSVDLIGSDFLEFSIKGGNPKGLGRQLEAITTRFLEVLTSQGGTSVGAVLISKRKQELDIAERENAGLQERLAAALPGGLEAYRTRIKALDQLDQRLGEAGQTLASVNARLKEVRGQLGDPNLTSEQGQQEVANLGDGRNSGPANPQTGNANAAPPSARLAQLRKFLDLDRSRSTLQTEIGNDTGNRERLKHSLDANEAIIRQFEASEKSLASMREIFEAYQRRFGSSATNRGASVLSAPERIIVVDPPADPELGGTPKLYFLLSGVTAGVLIGLSLAAAAEFLDATVRYPGQLIAMTGVPIIARLPSKGADARVPAVEAAPMEVAQDNAVRKVRGESLW